MERAVHTQEKGTNLYCFVTGVVRLTFAPLICIFHREMWI